MPKTVTCIICPKSCTIRFGQDYSVVNKEEIGCSKGKKYALDEAKDPRRVLTSTVSIEGGEFNRVPVRTSKPIRKEDWRKAAETIHKVRLKAPLEFHATVIKDFMEKGIDLITTRKIDKKTPV